MADIPVAVVQNILTHGASDGVFKFFGHRVFIDAHFLGQNFQGDWVGIPSVDFFEYYRYPHPRGLSIQHRIQIADMDVKLMEKFQQPIEILPRQAGPARIRLV